MAIWSPDSETLVTGSIKPSSAVTPRIIGVAGGSGSGKTYFAEALMRALGAWRCQIVSQDNFYIDQSARFDRDGGTVNFDHPSSIDFTLLALCLGHLREGRAAKIPLYDFVTHSRRKETLLVVPKPVIIVDGILILHAEEVREQLDERVFFATSEELRFERRQRRDVEERGRTLEGVREQFVRQVKPMHDQFVEPSKVHADRVVGEGMDYALALADFTARFLSI